MLQSLLAAEGSGGQRGGSEGAACQISQCNHSTRVTARGINVQNVLHAINYDMPSTTTCHQLRHAINYDMPSTTTCHQLRHAIDYDMPSRCGQQGQLARRRNMTILQRQQGQQGQLARRRNMTILRPVIFVSAGPTSSASLPDIAT
ncbi:uncharacterized protein FFUJ_04310 [Fusarium fujikuroi IMI 58289]|uniref:Uncharacterized protein n=1 Tax=Gibberella fujikuroi (strain CBS 195.34 / IMI 58289 / NRRL A-6831) TaxID=1279085 RepID=S0DPV2_GIBF5|nr:uncharacterized protein FFUJ_04310 [Fusarium fujikuroi IMI 58289]CCT64466.1 uncharacterized protein FFUJ_04310 [Fusarium fujikuroi IMI 58289]SCN88307.1 uncharacterized protein FFM5_04349 [Fusarium fujikuroi]